MTTSAYRTLTAVEEAFKAIVWSPLIKIGEIYIEGQVPFLALPVIKQLDEFTIGEITDALYNQIVLLVDVSAIRLVNPVLQNKWAVAAESLSLIATEQGVTSDAYKKALQTAASDFATWVHTG